MGFVARVGVWELMMLLADGRHVHIANLRRDIDEANALLTELRTYGIGVGRVLESLDEPPSRLVVANRAAQVVVVDTEGDHEQHAIGVRRGPEHRRRPKHRKGAAGSRTVRRAWRPMGTNAFGIRRRRLEYPLWLVV